MTPEQEVALRIERALKAYDDDGAARGFAFYLPAEDVRALLAELATLRATIKAQRKLVEELAKAEHAITGTMLAHMPTPEARAVVLLKRISQDLAATLPPQAE